VSAVAEVRELPADVYDVMELGALEWNGIGAGSFGDTDTPIRCPYCAFGLARWIDSGDPYGTTFGAVAAALRESGLDWMQSDRAVKQINKRLGKDEDARVPFDLWTAELGISRGPTTAPRPRRAVG
jgi:hypothetical protein